MLTRILPTSPIQAAAFFWGISCFLPIGMLYVSAFALILALFLRAMAHPQAFSVRWLQVRQHVVFWPLGFFVAWTIFIFCVQPRFAETSSNLFHGLRIAITIYVVLLLHKSELLSALRGWVGGSLLALLIVYFNTLIPLPKLPGLHNLIMINGNKSISNAVLLTLFAACACMYSLSHFQHTWKRWSMLAMFLVLPVLIWLLPSRTSLIVMSLSLLAGLVHLYRSKPFHLVAGILILMLMVIGVSQSSHVKDRFAQGTVEMQASMEAVQGKKQVSAHEMEVSWGIRYLFYKHTLDMVIEKPVLGWGIGSWNDQWRARTPKNIHHANMPHNDFLWMGAQAGLLGMLSLVAIMVSLLIGVIGARNFAATCSIMATCGLLVAMSFNSALRDAQFGMSILFVVVVLNAYACAKKTADSS